MTAFSTALRFLIDWATSMHNPKIEEAAAKYLNSIGPDAHWRRADVLRHLVAFAEEAISLYSRFGLRAEPVAGQHQNASGNNHAANVPAPAGTTPDEASNFCALKDG